MNRQETSNKPSTGTTSTTEPSAKLSEADYIAQQAAEARAAITQTIDQLKAHLAEGVDPRQWAKEYPLVSLGAAVVAGFAAAYAMVPSKEEQAIKRLEKIHQAMTSPTVAPMAGAPPASSVDGTTPAPLKPGGGLMSMLGRELITAIKPVLMSALTAGITAKAATSENESDQPPHPEGRY